MIQITVNNSSYQFNTKVLLSEALLEVGSPLKGIAVAVNQQVVPFSDWGKTFLIDNDEVLIIQATQGG